MVSRSAGCLSHVGRVLTGIEIHPGAKIGNRVFIDHGMGVVIGETAEVGDDVTLYQGVTLGGTSLEKGKRHPTLKNGVIVGGGAMVLGPITVGERAIVGANAVVVKDVPEGATVAGVPAKIVRGRRKAADGEFCAYGTPEDLPDPIAKSVDGLMDIVHRLTLRIEQLEQETRELKLVGEAARAEEEKQARKKRRPCSGAATAVMTAVRSYFDYNATVPAKPEVIEAMAEALAQGRQSVVGPYRGPGGAPHGRGCPGQGRGACQRQAVRDRVHQRRHRSEQYRAERPRAEACPGLRGGS